MELLLRTVAPAFRGDEFPRRLCEPPTPSVTLLFYITAGAASGSDDQIISKGVGDYRVYVGIRHPAF